MNSIDSSLAQLLFQQDAGIPDQVWSKILKGPAMSATLVLISPDILNETRAEIRNSIDELFKTNLVDFLLAGWSKYRELTEALEASKQKPTDTFLTPLVPHTLKLMQHPYVEVFADNKLVGKIVFGLTVALEIKALKLKIQGGRIVEILSGSCQGSITLAYDDNVLAEAKTSEVALPGKIKTTAKAESSHQGSDTDATVRIKSAHSSG